jgi:hypothetical protein
VELARFLKPERVELNDPFFDEHHAVGKVSASQLSPAGVAPPYSRCNSCES